MPTPPQVTITENWPGGIKANGEPVQNPENDTALEARRMARKAAKALPTAITLNMLGANLPSANLTFADCKAFARIYATREG